MFLSVYKETETKFDHQGEFKINVAEMDSNIFRQLNSFFYATFRLEDGARNKELIKMRQIIKLPTPNKKHPWQLFRITEEVEDLQGTLYTAYHISYDMAINFIKDLNVVGQTRKQAAQYIIDNSLEPAPFNVVDIQDPQDQGNLRIVRKHTLEALMGDDDNTLINRYRCEFDFDNFDVILSDQVGEKTNYLITDNKNIAEYEKSVDLKPLATRIIPQGADELLLPEYYIDSPLIGYYDQIFYKHIIFDDIRITQEGDQTDGEVITREKALELLRQAVADLYAQHIDEPFVCFTLKIDDIQNDADYQHIKDFLKLDIGDEVLLRKKGLFTDVHTRILSYTYNFYSDRFDEIVLSNIIKDFTISIDKTVADIKWQVDSFKVQISNIDETFKAYIEIFVDSILQKVEALETKIENISEVDVGVRNLIYNSTWNLGINFNWTNGSNFTLLEPEKDKPNSAILYYNRNDLEADAYSQKWSNEIEIKDPEKQYSISLDFKFKDKLIIDGNKMLACIRTFDEPGKTSEADSVWQQRLNIDMFEYELKENEWIRITYTFKPDKGKFLRIAPYVTRNAEFFWREMKLETGNRATDWTNAPEDLKESIDGVFDNIADTKVEITQKYEAAIEVAKNSITQSVSETYSTKTELGSVESSLSSLIQQTAEDINFNFIKETEIIKDDLGAFKDEIHTYIRFSADGLELGQIGNKFKAILTNTKLAFTEDNAEIAYISNKKMYITDAEVKNQLTLGKFAFVPRSNGNTSLRYIG